MTAFRWWLSKQINVLAWWVCPQPHRHRLEASWQAVKTDWIDEMCAQVRREAKP